MPSMETTIMLAVKMAQRRLTLKMAPNPWPPTTAATGAALVVLPPGVRRLAVQQVGSFTVEVNQVVIVRVVGVSCLASLRV